jgi:flagellum-specific ATP synthase
MDVVSKMEKKLIQLKKMEAIRVDGKVSRITGLIVEAASKFGTVGDLCKIEIDKTNSIEAEIAGFRGHKILLTPLGETIGISPGSKVIRSPLPLKISVGENLLGRVVDGLGRPIDGKGPITAHKKRSIYNEPPNPLERARISQPLCTGIRAIDGFITLGKGQRVGIFAGSGVGKSVLMGMISRYTDADINVIALIGERGREVREFIEQNLGEEGLKRSVVIVATSDKAATVRIKAALLATSIAEYFRDCGKNVLLMMDSLTRVAMAQREIGLAIGEPPASKGYTPSVFALMPRLLERAGNSHNGTITGLYTVLVEGDDMDEPISDSARSILDGHIVLSRKIAAKGHYPAIDVLASISRVRDEVISEAHKTKLRDIIELLALYRENEDLINIGAYNEGNNPKLDEALKHMDKINRFLKQDVGDNAAFETTLNQLNDLIGKAA